MHLTGPPQLVNTDWVGVKMVLNWAILIVLLGTVTANGDSEEMCTGDYYENGRPPAGTKCVEVNNKICYMDSGRWGKSWCHTEVGSWGAECDKCSGGAGECKHTDKNKNCAYWRDNNYCTDTKWESWMEENCAKSCKCEGSSCVDKHTSCAAWTSRGECTKNPGYMNISCAKSCGKCGGTGGTGTTVTTRPVVVTGNNKFGCNGGVKSYPRHLPNPEFYQKICYSAQGIKIISSNLVSDAALERTAYLIDHVMQKVDPRVSKMMNSNKLRYAVIAAYPKEEIKTLPEYSHFPFWPARGVGATMGIPIGSSAVENIMCQENNGHKGQDITIHEFAHSLHLTGLASVFPGFRRELHGLFRTQRRAGLWRRTYANTNEMEYFAEGVQSYFNANNQIIPGVNEGITRDQLRRKDPNLYKFVDRYLGRNYWNWSCP